MFASLTQRTLRLKQELMRLAKARRFSKKHPQREEVLDQVGAAPRPKKCDLV